MRFFKLSWTVSAVLATLAVAGCAGKHLVPPPAQRVAEPTLITGVHVLQSDGTRSEPVNVLIADGVIKAVTPEDSTATGTEVDGSGKTLMLGLVDSHVHIGSGSGLPHWKFAPPDNRRILEAFVYCGVTDVIIAAQGLGTERFDDAQQANRLTGPRMLRASRTMKATGGHPEPMMRALVPALLEGYAIPKLVHDVDDPDEAAREVDEEIARTRPEVIKVIYNALPEESPHLSQETMAAVVARTKERGLRAIVHVGSASQAVEAAEAGAWILMHVPWEDRLTPEQMDRIRATGVPMVTTARIYSQIRKTDQQAVEFGEIEREVLSESVIAAFAAKPKNYATPPEFARLERQLPRYEENLAANIVALHEAGVPLLAGTDSGAPGLFHGAALHRELEALVELGLPASDVLRMATTDARKWLYPKEPRGIEVGASADLVLVDGDPTEDITATQRIEAVWQGGARVR